MAQKKVLQQTANGHCELVLGELMEQCKELNLVKAIRINSTYNLYELLGNDPELDPDLKEPEPPTRAIDKPVARHGKRDAPAEPRAAAAPTSTRGGRGGRGGRFAGNEQAFRDREAGSRTNRGKVVEANPRDVPTGVVKNRDVRGNLLREDRHNRQDRTVTHKQADQGWGATSGESNLRDEQIGEAIAQTEEKEAAAAGEGNAVEAEPEPEDKAKSYAEYLAEQAAQRNEELGVKAARKPNEGVKEDKKWANAKPLTRDEEEEAYIKGKEEKARREKARKEKAYLEVDMRFVEPPRGGREGGRGGRGRGGRDGERGGRGGGRGRGGEFRGGAPRGGRGGPAGPSVSVDEKNFPALGGK
ncbi:hypothetical protein AJ79_00762 [Helicocarpus griseus UAMH5409]|uniref:Hyaluronan/mRNA-binding protein domain-containing protein n=1 Tax=Helicocarpus griseus UAMH5409 TaxID=1447875 RepID=A0A2B7YAS0_9EURO|nr:hypothetical protein AJ79_00762 [Helicocarpus griseus UAMH5409]